MNPIDAMNQTDQIVTGLIAGLTLDQREMPTPCDEWTVHDLINHMCGGAHMIAAHLAQAATPEALAATHQLPFGETPGEMALGRIGRRSGQTHGLYRPQPLIEAG